jgi:hypothetical protein
METSNQTQTLNAPNGDPNGNFDYYKSKCLNVTLSAREKYLILLKLDACLLELCSLINEIKEFGFRPSVIGDVCHCYVELRDLLPSIGHAMADDMRTKWIVTSAGIVEVRS